MEFLKHLNDGDGRPICNKFLSGEDLLDWENRGAVNCRDCIQLVEETRIKWNRLLKISDIISNIQELLNDNNSNIDVLLDRKAELLKEEKKYYPTTNRETYIICLLAVDRELEKTKL